MNLNPESALKDRPTFQRILVTGSTGFLGHHVMPRLREAFPEAELIGLGRRDFDLLEPGAPAAMLRRIQPDCVVHMAAKSGGILTNKKRPADFFYDNQAMNLHVFH